VSLRGTPYRGRNSTFRDSMSVPQLVFLARPPIVGNAGIFTPRWTIKASLIKTFADRRRIGGRVFVSAGQNFEQNYWPIARDS